MVPDSQTPPHLHPNTKIFANNCAYILNYLLLYHCPGSHRYFAFLFRIFLLLSNFYYSLFHSNAASLNKHFINNLSPKESGGSRVSLLSISGTINYVGTKTIMPNMYQPIMSWLGRYIKPI